jgi:lysyl-tRNA synthetase class 2
MTRAPDTSAWRPAAGIERLRARAGILRALRGFLDARGALEVETPALVTHAVTDPNLESVEVRVAGLSPRFLHTSPEYAMKRLLAAGSGDIWQMCRVARAGERSRTHNPEFTMLEWYRTGWGMERLIDEVAQLANAALEMAGRAPRPVQRLRYRDAFRDALGIDPISCGRQELENAAEPLGLAAATRRALSRDELLDLLIAARIGPRLGAGTLCFLTHYPASQAALARLDPCDPATALRFELYADGLELANGFDELADPTEQRARFAADSALRQARGAVVHAPDERLLAALSAGLPACAGVALGVDRLVMIATGATGIDETLAFPWERA